MGVTVRSLNRILVKQSIITDNIIFRLHYKVTVAVLVVFGIGVLCWQYFGYPINCMSKDDIPTSLLNDYCWMQSSFSIEEAWSKKVGDKVPYPGIEHYRPGERRKFHHFYQWVGFALLAQAMFFYLPRFIYKNLESRQINKMILNLSTTYDDKNNDVNKNILVHYFVSKFNKHMCYFMLNFICEISNVINVISQIFLIDKKFDGGFSSHGTDIFSFMQWNSTSEYYGMVQTFPRLAKCTFYKYGSSGDVQRHDAMCALSMIGLHETIYLYMWLWFIILAVLSCMVVVYRIALFLSYRIRASILLIRARQSQEEHIEAILGKCNVGDWFLLDLMCTNMDPVNFHDVIRDIALRTGEDKHFHEV